MFKKSRYSSHYSIAIAILWCTAANCNTMEEVTMDSFQKNSIVKNFILNQNQKFQSSNNSLTENRIQDLKVISTDRILRIVILTWTATAHDTFFELRYHRDPHYLKSSFEKCYNAYTILNGTFMSILRQPYNAQFVILQLPIVDISMQNSNETIYFAIQAKDMRGNATELSNIVSAAFNLSTYYRNIRYERIIAAMVLTSVILSIVCSIVVLIFCKLRRHYNNNNVFDYHNHTELVYLNDDQVSIQKSYSRRQSLTLTTL